MAGTAFRISATVCGFLGLLAGLLGLLLFRVMPPGGMAWWGLPPLVLAGSAWLLWRAWGGWRWMVVPAVALVTAWFLFRLVYPDPGGLVPRPGPAAGSPAPGEPLPAAPIPGGRRIDLGIPPQYRQGPFGQSRSLEAPEGFRVALFAAGLEGPRMLAVSPAGDLYVSLPRAGEVAVLPDRDRDGVADRVVTFAGGLDRPHGLAFVGGGLVVAETGSLVLLHDRDGDLRADQREILSRDIPGGGMHWTRTVVPDPGGGFFVSVGSSCNACVEEDRRRGAILWIPDGGGEAEVYASGLRNSVGLAVHPATGELWGANNGRDMLGDNLPPEELNRIVRGGDYGWPFCYGRRVPDPAFSDPARCDGTREPELLMQAHSAPLGIAFGEGLDFPEPYPSMLFLGFHGSWNRTVPTGYKLVGIPFAEGRPAGPVTEIVTGWLEGASAWGRPVAPAVGADGALYLSDDRAGAIYRIDYRKPKQEEEDGRR